MPAGAHRARGASGRRVFVRAWPGVCLVALGATLVTSAAAGADYRRPGLEGQWSSRHLTAPMNSLRVIAGPGQPMLMGERYGDQVIDGGAQFVHPHDGDPTTPDENQWWFRGGVAFGLTEDWEAGALFIPLQFTPKVKFQNVTAFVTRGFRLGAIDLGIRLSFQTPALKAYDLKGWSFNPGVPILYRAGPFRLDAAVLVPIATADGSVGVNVPVRASVSITPRIFAGLESGAFDSHVGEPRNMTMPIGALVGYTELFGSKVVDFTASFGWDDFWLPSPPPGRDHIEIRDYRVGFGLVYHTLVR